MRDEGKTQNEPSGVSRRVASRVESFPVNQCFVFPSSLIPHPCSHPGGHPNPRPPSKCMCKWGTVWPPASLQLMTRR